MEELVAKLEELREKWSKYWREKMSVMQTRIVFIDPILSTLGWDIHDPEQVRVEIPIGGGRTMSYALRDKGRNLLFIMAVPLDSPINDPAFITQVVQDTAASNVKWCAITNGVIWKFYSSLESCPVLDRLLYEVYYNAADQDLNKPASLLWPFSKREMQKGELDKIWERLFTDSRIRRSVNKIMKNPPDFLMESIKVNLQGIKLSDERIKESLIRIWNVAKEETVATLISKKEPSLIKKPLGEPKLHYIEESHPEEHVYMRTRARKMYDENHHTSKRKHSIVELYKEMDRYCLSLNKAIYKTYRALYITWEIEQLLFASLHIHTNKLRGWINLPWDAIQNKPPFIRNVIKIKHWGSGDMEFNITRRDQLENLKPIINISFDYAVNKLKKDGYSLDNSPYIKREKTIKSEETETEPKKGILSNYIKPRKQSYTDIEIESQTQIDEEIEKLNNKNKIFKESYYKDLEMDDFTE
ncbi:MAG: hypothetical protein JXA60_08020 [Candidatus Coatesbacteria bacterium]|nr:hypothetical protein [Candidatus Coatesbacteria bacterium]